MRYPLMSAVMACFVADPDRPPSPSRAVNICFPPEPLELMRLLGSDLLTYAENLKKVVDTRSGPG